MTLRIALAILLTVWAVLIAGCVVAYATVRWALVEMARHAIKRQDAVGGWARRLAVRKGLYKARVALARVLCDQVVTTWPKTV